MDDPINICGCVPHDHDTRMPEEQAATSRMFGADTFAAMKEGSYFCNVARYLAGKPPSFESTSAP